jgi:hypothetical protein
MAKNVETLFQPLHIKFKPFTLDVFTQAICGDGWIKQLQLHSMSFSPN